MILLSVICLISLSYSQAQVNRSVDDLLVDVFGKTSSCSCMPYHKCIANPAQILPTPTPETNTENEYGANIINIRFGDKETGSDGNRFGDNETESFGNRIGSDDEKCNHYLDKCCIIHGTDTISTTTTTTTTTTVSPNTHTSSPNRTITPAENKCGDRHLDGVGFKITGDKHNEANYGEFPWMVAVIRRDKVLDDVTLKVMECGGSIIHPKVILTAAHCVKGKHDLYIRAAEWDTQTENEFYQTQDRDVKEVVIHENYYAGGLYNDVALLVLDKALEMNPVVGTLCLPEHNENMEGRRCVVSGWGKDVFGKAGKYQVILKRVEQPIVKSDTCEAALRRTRLGPRFKLHNSFVCAGGEVGNDTCKGDGGGPLACPSKEDPNVYVQAGIVAWGIGCGTNTPSVYASVPYLRSWIDDQMAKRNVILV